MLLTALEVAFLVLAVAGIALWSTPAAMLVAGLIGAAACEYAQRTSRAGTSTPGDRA